MKVSIDWLKELVEIQDINEVIRLLPLRTIGTKEITKDFIELDMKGYNRADLLSMRGVAIEVAAITGSEVKFEEEDVESSLKHVQDDKVIVEVKNPELCPIYCVAKIENLKVEQSNESWVKKLSDCGMRSVNNVADITNLVMLEYGQPLHAFDARAVKDEAIIVRTAKAGERITTLDGKTRDLEKSDLLIADPQNNLGIAGVMGGKDSEISSTTTTILLEAAIFDPSSLRKTSTRLNLPSDASKRFYHGLTKKRLFQALDAAIKMYGGIGGKLTGLTIVGNFPENKVTITLTKEKLDSLIGINIPSEEVEKYLESLHFNLSRSEVGWEVTPPYFRLDVNIEADLVEEVARMYGYEKIPAKELPGAIPPKIDQSFFELIYKLKESLVDLGLTEIQTYSFYSTQVLNACRFPLNALVKIANPISSETEYLKDNLWPNLLEKAAQNVKQGFKDIAIFEIGKVYKDGNETPNESYRFAILLINETQNPITELYATAKEALQKAEKKLDTKEISWNSQDRELFHPNRWTGLALNSQKNMGIMAEIHPRIVNKFGLEQRVAVLEIEL